MNPIKLQWLVVLGLALALGAAWAQGQSSPPTRSAPQPHSEQATDSTAQTESVADPDQDLPTEPNEPATGAAEEPAKVPEEIQQAIDDQDQLHATMARFIPTEKLSEDRAVSFPNDI